MSNPKPTTGFTTPSPAVTPTRAAQWPVPKWVVVLGLGALFVVLAATAIRLLTPAPAVIPETPLMRTNLDDSQSTFAQLQYVGPELSIPGSISLVEVRGVATTEEAFNQLLTQTELVPTPGYDNLWNSDVFSLNFDPVGKTYTLAQNAAQTSPLAPGINVEQSSQQAQERLQALFPQLELSIVPGTAQAYSGGGHLEEIDANQASLFGVAFSYSINGLPVVYDDHVSYPFTMILNQAGEIVKLTFPSQLISFTTLSQTTPLTITQALNQLSTTNQGSIITSFTDNTDQIYLESIVAGELETAQLEYRLDTSTQFVYPVYRFSGELVNDRGQVIRSELITPAVSVR